MLYADERLVVTKYGTIKVRFCDFDSIFIQNEGTFQVDKTECTIFVTLQKEAKLPWKVCGNSSHKYGGKASLPKTIDAKMVLEIESKLNELTKQQEIKDILYKKGKEYQEYLLQSAYNILREKEHFVNMAKNEVETRKQKLENFDAEFKNIIE